METNRQKIPPKSITSMAKKLVDLPELENEYSSDEEK
jgi:hypothetical protein